jgi:hypothetical protein
VRIAINEYVEYVEYVKPWSRRAPMHHPSQIADLCTPIYPSICAIFFLLIILNIW